MVQVSGKLKSHFAAEAQASTASGTSLLAESKGEPRVIVAGGSMALWDDFMGRPNQALLLNVAGFNLVQWIGDQLGHYRGWGPVELTEGSGVVVSSPVPPVSDGKPEFLVDEYRTPGWVAPWTVGTRRFDTGDYVVQPA